MAVTVNKADVQISNEALSEAKLLAKQRKAKRQFEKRLKVKKERLKQKEQFALLDPEVQQKILKERAEASAEASAAQRVHWIQTIADVSARSDLSDLHKLMLEALSKEHPRFVPMKKGHRFANFMLNKSILAERKKETEFKKNAIDLHRLLTKAQQEALSKKTLAEEEAKKTPKKAEKEAEGKTKIEMKPREKKEAEMEEDDDSDVDMDEVETEIKSEDESEDDADEGERLQVKRHSKKKRKSSEKVGKKVLQGKVNKNKKGKGKNSKKRRS